MKKIYSLLLALMLLTTGSLFAQHTIGGQFATPEPYSVLKIVSQYKTDVYGGLRLPQLTTDQRNALMVNGQAEAKGLLIYNTTIDCIENWNGSNWISLCSASTQITTDCPTSLPFTADGSQTRNCTVVDPSCKTAGNYLFSIVAGSEYVTLVVTDAGAGKFSLAFSQNDRADVRTAIIMVTSPCGNTSLFSYTQDGDATGCGTTTVPATISSGNGADLCGSGAAYLYLNKPATAGVFIWTLNGQEVGRGNTYIATVSGTYIVYGDKIGCTNKVSKTVTLGNGTAPDPVTLVWASNNGVQCAAGDPITLKASRTLVSPEVVVWYRDGLKQTSGSDYTVNDGIGLDITTTKSVTWIAVVENGSCSSTPSNSIDIAASGTGTPAVGAFSILVNGAAPKLCAGGTHVLTVSPVDAAATYDWYVGSTKIGTGNGYVYNVPDGFNGTVNLSVTATKGTNCPVTRSVSTSVTVTAPSLPQLIADNTDGVVCNGSSMTLSATGGNTYEWYKDDVLQSGSTTYQLVVSASGTYKVRAVDAGGCYSPFASKVIKAANANNIAWENSTGTAKTGINYTFSVKTDGSNPNPDTYTWYRGASGTTVIAGQTGRSITGINFAGDEIIKVTATNTCGTSTLTQTVTFDAQCTPPTFLVSGSDSTVIVTAGSPLSLSFGSISGDVQSYQWTKNGSPISPDGNSAVYSKGGATWATGDAGVYTLQLTAKAGCSPATASAPYKFNVTVINPSDYTELNATLSMSGNVCFDTKENYNMDAGDGNNGSEQARTADILPVGSFPYVVSCTGTKTIASVIWQVDNMSFYSHTATSTAPNTTFTITFTDLETIKRLVADGRKANPAQTIKITAYVTYASGTPLRERISKYVKIQDFICCDGYVCVGCAWDYSTDATVGATGTKNTAGDWARTGTASSSAVSNTGIRPAGNTIDGAWGQNDIPFKAFFAPTGSGDLCVYKKDAIQTNSWVTAINKCQDGTGADGIAGYWYIPNLMEQYQLYLQLPGTNGVAGSTKLGTKEFFGNSSDAAPLLAGFYFSSTEWTTTLMYQFHFYYGGRAHTSKIIYSTTAPARCVRRM